MHDGVGVPAFGEHGYGDNATDVLAERPFLADCIHDLAQNFRLGDGICRALAVDASVFAFEDFDFIREDFFEVVIDLIGILKRVAVDQQCWRFFQRFFRGPVVVRKQIEMTGDSPRLVFGYGLFVAGDVLVDFFGNGSVVAHDNKNRRAVEQAAYLFVSPLIVVVEFFQGGLDQRGKLGGSSPLSCLPSLAGRL